MAIAPEISYRGNYIPEKNLQRRMRVRRVPRRRDDCASSSLRFHSDSTARAHKQEQLLQVVVRDGCCDSPLYIVPPDCYESKKLSLLRMMKRDREGKWRYEGELGV